MYNGSLSVMTQSLDPLSEGTQTITDDGPALPVGTTGKYTLRVYVDKSIIEAHVNARRSVTTRFYPLDLDPTTGAFGLKLCNDGPTQFTVDSIEVWGMKGIY
jgi:hypothetical protein